MSVAEKGKKKKFSQYEIVCKKNPASRKQSVGNAQSVAKGL